MDLTEMDRRKRVQEVLEAKDFCQELEEVIALPANAKGPTDAWQHQRQQGLSLPRNYKLSGGSLYNLNAAAPTIPICDLPPANQSPSPSRSPSSSAAQEYSKVERVLRCKLASLYRLADLFQWSQGIYNHITLRLPSTDPSAPVEILINPFGLLYHEITASSLIKLNLKGEVLNSGSTRLGVNQAGYVLHSAIHEAREDVKCVLHLHTAVVAAVSSMKCGLLPICQEAMIIGPIAYHDYKGIVSEEEEKRSIVEDLGDKNVMLLRNHGFVACGESVEDALHLAFHCIIACETQVLLMRGRGFVCCGESVEHAFHITSNLIRAADQQIRAIRASLENLIIPDAITVEKAYKTARQGGGGVNRLSTATDQSAPSPSPKWRIGELEWEAWMRVLDSGGHHTGHLYRNPSLKPLPMMSRSRFSTSNLSEIATPPTSSSMGQLNESNSEAMAAHRLHMLRREQERVRWLNSPNSYQKVHLFETGTHNPKMITKWVQESGCSSSNCTPTKVQQFSPPGSGDPKEFRTRQRRMKEERLAGLTSAGPRSLVFDGMVTRGEGAVEDGRPVLIGAASRGIIDRPYQCNAQVYRQLYAPNPFQSETDTAIQSYLREMDAKYRSSTTGGGGGGEVAEGGDPLEAPPLLIHDGDDVSLMEAARDRRASSVHPSVEANDNSKRNGQRSKSATVATAKEKEKDHPATTVKKGKRGLFSFLRRKKFTTTPEGGQPKVKGSKGGKNK